jgi:hypothetical protein
MKKNIGGSHMARWFVVAPFLLLAATAGAQSDVHSTAANKTGGTPAVRVLLPELELQGTTPTIFSTLAREAGFSGGVAISNEQCSRDEDSSITVPAGTRFDVALGRFASQRAMFEWQLRDGVVDLFPKGSIPPLLKVQIRRFEWDTATPVPELIDRLRQLPEVSEEALKLGLEEAPIEGGASAVCIRGDCRNKPQVESQTEEEKGATLLTVLNRIVLAHSGSVWIYSEYHCGNGKLFSLETSAQ